MRPGEKLGDGKHISGRREKQGLTGCLKPKPPQGKAKQPDLSPGH